MELKMRKRCPHPELQGYDMASPFSDPLNGYNDLGVSVNEVLC